MKTPQHCLLRKSLHLGLELQSDHRCLPQLALSQPVVPSYPSAPAGGALMPYYVPEHALLHWMPAQGKRVFGEEAVIRKISQVRLQNTYNSKRPTTQPYEPSCAYRIRPAGVRLRRQPLVAAFDPGQGPGLKEQQVDDATPLT